MAKKPVIQKCKVVRNFFMGGKMIKAGTSKKDVFIDLEEPFATEMKQSLKVEFVEAEEAPADKTPAGGGDDNK